MPANRLIQRNFCDETVNERALHSYLHILAFIFAFIIVSPISAENC